MIEFFISRNGQLTEGDIVRGEFGSVDAAADFAVRFAQDCDAPYRIFYPL